MRFRYFLIASLMAASVCAARFAAAAPPNGLDYSTDITVSADSLTLTPADAVVDDFSQAVFHRSVLPTGLQGMDGTNLIALGTALVSGVEQRWFAFDTWMKLPSGDVARPGQPFRCVNDACTSAVLFTLPDLPDGAMLDAFAIDPANGDALFSLDTGTTIDGMNFNPSDVIRLHGSAYSLELGGASLDGLNLDTLDLLEDGRWLLGFDTAFNAAGSAFSDDDVLAFDAGTDVWSFFYAPRVRNAAFIPANIDALAVARDLNDRIFADGFE